MEFYSGQPDILAASVRDYCTGVLKPYVYAEWKQCRAGLDYHIDVGRHYYSVPYDVVARTQVVLVIGCSTSDLDT